MDSDDNDYHGQGLHLVGEESSEISPVLHPYALPKFDFDEGNIRFDSLVENEVFLGIPSQDDNQWIEDFSRGSTGINFSSSAADSCSIPRHNNVWSEATSSESVEMLLKSVGQEEMVLGESVVEDSNTRNELPSSNQMDTDLMHDRKIGDGKDSSSGTPPAQFHQDFSPLNKPDVKPNVAPSHGFDQPVDACASVGERTSIVVTGQNLPVDVKGDDEIAREGCNLIDESLIGKNQEDNLAISCVSSDSITGSGILNAQDKGLDISPETSGLPVEINIVGGHGASDIGFVMDDGKVMKSPTQTYTRVLHSAVHVSSETEALSENAVKTTISIEQSPMLPPQGNSGLSTEEGCKSEALSPELAKISTARCVALTEGTDNEQQSESKDPCCENSCTVIRVGDGCSTEQSAVVSEIGNACGSEQSFAVINNDQCIIYSDPEKESVVPKVMSGSTTDGVDAVFNSGGSSNYVDHVEPTEIKIVGGHGASDIGSVLDDGQVTKSPTQMHTSVLSAVYVAPETEVLSDNAVETTTNIVGGHGTSDISFVLDDRQVMKSPSPMHNSALHSAVYVPEMEVLSENTVKTMTNIEQSPMLPPQGNSGLPTEEGCNSEAFSPELEKVSSDGCVALTEGTDNELQSESKDLCGEKSCAVTKVGDGCSREQSPVVSEIDNGCGNEQSFSVSNNDHCIIYPELEKEPVVPRVMSGSKTDGDDAVSISGDSSKYVDHVEPAGTVSSLNISRGMSAVQEPDDGIPFNAMQERNDENLSDSVNKNSERDEAFFIIGERTQSVDHVQPTKAISSLKISTDMSAEQDSHDGKPLTVMLERNDEILTSDSVNTKSERVEASFISGGITKSVNHVKPTEAISSLKFITGMSDEQDSHDGKPLNVMQERNNENLTSDSINTNFDFVPTVGDGNNIGVRSSKNVTEEIVGSTSGPDFGSCTAGEMGLDARMVGNGTGSHNEINFVPSASVGADDVVKNIHPSEDQMSPTMLLAASNSVNKQDKEGTVILEDSMEYIDEEMKQGPGAIVIKSAPAIFTAETEAKDANQSMNMVELHGGETNVEQVMTMVGQEPCSAESVSLHSDCVVRVRDGAESGDHLKLREEVVIKGGLTLSGEVAGNINSVDVVDQCIDSAPVVSASEISNNDKEQSCMAEGKNKDIPLSRDADVVVENLSSTLQGEGMKVTIEKESSEGATGILEEERSFTFHDGPLPVLSGRETSPVEGAHSTSKPVRADSKVVQETSHGSPQMHDQRASSGGSKGTSERKSRRGSGKLAKGNPAKGNCSKEAESKIQREVGDTLCVVLSPSGTVKAMPLEAGSSATKPTSVVAHSSNLPDLNTSTSTAVLFRQPFTDLQQVQLRAQIFVYGSLIQGAAPDEACMVSAFGTSDGGRNIWESAWRACIQRLQKSHLSNPETPVQSRSGAKASDQVTKTGLSQRKPRMGSKGNSSAVVNPIIPLSSPLWNISTPSCDALPTNTVARSPVDYQTLPPLHSYQTPASRHFSGHTRLSQAPFPIPWVASPQASPFDVNAHIAPSQPTEIVKLTPVKVSLAPSLPATMHASPVSVSQGGHSAVVCGPSALHETKKVAASYAPHSVDSKSRKRKKTSVSEDLGQIAFPVARGQTESVSPSVTTPESRKPALGDPSLTSLPPEVQVENVSSFAANSQFSTTVAIPIPFGPGLKSNTEKAVKVVSPVSSIDHPASCHQITEKRALSLDEVAKVEEAKLQAEQASAHAAAAVSHCQNVWSQLQKQNSSHVMSDSEAKLASAAVCIAAAASVAKAASAAAKVASTVALQAKLMADEALTSNGCLDSVQNTSNPLSGFANDMGSATPVSILRVGEGNNGSSSIIYAAREAARRRVEAASAASKHAENLDAIVKAAELAAEAVAQAGKIVALGDPLPLSKLVEAGPAGYWKDSGTPFDMGSKSNIAALNNGLTSVEEHHDPTVEQSDRSLDSMLRAPVNDVSPDAVEKSKDLIEDQVKGKMTTSAVPRGGELEGQKSPAASEMTKTVGVVPEPESGLRSTTDENVAGIINDSRISVSSPVEVFKDNGDFTGAWFSANVLSLKNGKALVSYKDLETDEGKMTEWVPLEAGICKPPVIRLAHPMTSLMFDGTRKRRREVAKDYSWSVGDRVDAWLGNCWREGVIVEKNKKDDTTLSVHFPAQGKTVVVKAWHLRPTLIWTDGEWIESLSSGNEKSSQGDTPKEKRLKLGSPSVDGKGKDKITKIMDPPESRLLLPLSAKEKSFHIGSTKNDKPDTLRTMRSGLQKEGPKVVFGVPKPGKKRKFMEVSKHYVSSRNTKINANTDKEKSGKYLVPEGAHGWKNCSKIDPKEKQAAETRTRSFKSTKPPSSFTRTLSQKDKSVISSVSGSKDGFSKDNIRTEAISNDDSGDQSLNDFVSSSNIDRAEDPISSSSRAPLPRAPKKVAASNAKSERLMKGKVASALGKPTKVVEKETSVPDLSEPRRSNRKIQPTSRLLEGLQSSLIMSKAPLVFQDKSHKSHKNGAPSPRGARS